MLDQTVIEEIKDVFDLNSYEVKIWLALLSRGIASAGELAEMTGVPRSRTYDVLESLERKGLAIMRLGKPIKYIAANPKDVIEKMKKRVEQEMKERIKRIDELKNTDIWKEILALYERGIKKIDPTQISGAIRGRHHLHDRLEELFNEAEKEILIATSGTELNRIMEYHYTTLKAAKERGVKIFIAVQPEGVSERALEMAKELGEVRELSGFDTRFVIVDETETIMMLLPEKDIHPSYDTGVWIHSPFFAKSLRDMFMNAWRNMKVL